MEPGSTAKIMERLDDHQRWLEQLDHEGLKMRARLTELEQDRQLVRELAETTRELGKRAKEFADGIDAIAERAVEKVLELRRERTRASWKYRLGYAAAICSCSGFLFDHLHGHL